jgi:RNA polymerase sigma-70 factor (ECF subfamily)
MIQPDDETHLIERLKRRESQAMVALYDRFKRLVYSIAFQCVRNQAVAEDLTQETFWRVWNRIQSFDASRGNLEPWIATIARNRAVDYLRAGRNAQHYSLDSIEANPRFFAAGDSPESGAARLEREQLVTRALQSLSPAQREVIELTHFQGFTQTEIAEYLKRPLGTIKSTIRGALKALRQTLQEERA